MHDRNLTVREAHYSKQEELKYFQMPFPSEVKWLGMMGRRSILWKLRVLWILTLDLSYCGHTPKSHSYLGFPYF